MDINNTILMTDEVDNIEHIYLTFDVESEEYAVPIGYVNEIVGMQKISEVPDVPEFIRGVINLRGKVIMIMDARLRFGLPWRNYDERTIIIVMDLEHMPTGLVVDRVNEVVTIAPDNVTPPPRWHGAGEESVIKGLGKQEDRVSIILDAPRLLRDKEIFLDPTLVKEAKGAIVEV
jgi:purine-binding chemotaxis protein CheW